MVRDDSYVVRINLVSTQVSAFEFHKCQKSGMCGKVRIY